MIVIIKADIILSKNGKNAFVFKDGNIIMSENYIKVCVELKNQDKKTLALTLKDGELYLQNNVTYNNPTISGVPVELDLTGSYVFGLMSTSLKIEWKLSSIKYNIKRKETYNLFILNIPYSYLSSEIEGAEIEDTENKYNIKKIEDSPNCTMFITGADEGLFEKLRVHLAFFYNHPSEILVKAIHCNDNITHIERFYPKFNSYNDILFQTELAYIEIDSYRCINTFGNFIKYSTWNDLDEYDKNYLKQAVYTYVRSKSCDDSMAFLVIYSILDRFAGNKMKCQEQSDKTKRKNPNPYILMKEGLAAYRIDVSKIGKSSDSRINELKLVLERDRSKDREVMNFCDLRDYILHFMTTPKIDELLSSSELVSTMKFAAAIIILNKFGFNDYTFKSVWEDLSILINKAK